MKKICLKCGKEFSKPYNCSQKEWEKRKYCSHSCANSVNAIMNGKQFEKGIIPWNKEKKLPQFSGENNSRFSRVKLKCIYCGKEFWVKNYRKDEAKYCSKECHYKDNLGLSSENYKLRRSKKFSDWRKKVFERDNYTCQECGQVGGYLHPHHIKPFSIFPELRFDINNGITLCENCHKKTDTYGVNLWRNYKNILAVAEEA